ncbi:MAG: dihydroorotase [Planctomycetia bacterium]
MSQKVVCITGGRIIDPSQDFDGPGDLWIEGKRIVGLTPLTEPPPVRADQTIDAAGQYVVPGLIDMHVHFREPGSDGEETIFTGTHAALESGVTSVACMPDADPATDSQAAAEFVVLQAKRAGHAHVWPVGAVTKGRLGKELAEMGGLAQGGAVAFSDCDRPIAGADIMRRALQYAAMLGKTVLSHPEVPELTRNGLMNEGFYSTKLGMAGLPAAAEEIMVERDLRLAAWTGGRIHLQSLSTAGSVKALRIAKAAGARATAEAHPHHFTLTEELLESFDSNYKVNPPLRTRADVEAILDGLTDGTIDVVASGHSPRTIEQKQAELDAAPFGMIGVETLLPVSVKALVESGRLSWSRLIATLTVNPARVLGIPRGSLKVGAEADVALIDPDEDWVIRPSEFKSKARNCPFAGWKVRGRVQLVIVHGEVRFARKR